MTPALVWGIARALVRIFYRVGRVGAPVPDGAVLLVANHPNALLDPPIIVATSGRTPRFLAKSTLFSMPVIGWFVSGAGAIPVYRRVDAGADMSKNAEMFAAVERALAEGHAVCLFPEGMSHSTGRVEALKTGAARIALGAADDGTGVRIVPVGLNYDQQDRLSLVGARRLRSPSRRSCLAGGCAHGPVGAGRGADRRDCRSPPRRRHRGRSP